MEAVTDAFENVFYYFIGKKKVFMERIIQSQTEGKNFDVFLWDVNIPL